MRFVKKNEGDGLQAILIEKEKKGVMQQFVQDHFWQ